MIRKIRYLGILLLASLLLTGCGDLVEIQNRDFVLAMGISYQNGEYQVTYSLPDLGKVTEQDKSANGSSLTRTYQGKSLSEIEQIYNFNSENRLDYRHLQVIILDVEICSVPAVMKTLLQEINDNYDISHNVLVYYYHSEVSELMAMDGVNENIGEHLKHLNVNNHINGMESARIGALIDCLANERTLFIPALVQRDHSIAADGGIFFCRNQKVKQISQMDSNFYFITLGKGEEYLIRLSEEHLIRLEDIKVKTQYELTEQGPQIQIAISGAARKLPKHTTMAAMEPKQVNEQIGTQIMAEISEYLKQDGIDYLNLYEKSSYKNREMWLAYQNRQSEFVEDVDVRLLVDIHY